MESGVHVVSGTPGRVFDMIKRKALRTRHIRILVLDEADEMLSKGFKEQIYDVYRLLYSFYFNIYYKSNRSLVTIIVN